MKHSLSKISIAILAASSISIAQADTDVSADTYSTDAIISGSDNHISNEATTTLTNTNNVSSE